MIDKKSDRGVGLVEVGMGVLPVAAHLQMIVSEKGKH